MKKKLLIVMQEQYGYHTDTYKYCIYLKDSFDITYFGWDKASLPKINSEGIRVRYISRKGNKVKRYFRFLKEMHNEIRSRNYDLVFFVYFPGSSIIKLLNPVNTFNIDIRTGTISRSKIQSYLRNLLLRFECAAFKHKTIISASLADSLGIKRFHLLPLGGECFSNNKKTFEKLNLLYVGTLDGRNIIECVKGFHKVIEEGNGGLMADISFTIIGDSIGGEREEIQNYILQNNLGAFIRLEGYVHNSLLHHFFEDANVGISYVPITDCFEHQPPTKTFEYLLSGLPVIATNTKENAKIVKENHGVLIKDKVDAFASGVRQLVQQREYFDSEQIREFYKKNLWENIVNGNLRPYLISLACQRSHQETPALQT